MSKRIVVGLDPSEYSESAQSLARDRVKATGGTVIGVGVIDRPGIERTGRGAGVGAAHYAKKARNTKINEAQEIIDGLVEAFAEKCREAEVDFETEIHEGEPAEILKTVAEGADIIVIGSRTYFRFETQDEPGDTLSKLLRASICPVFVAPKVAVIAPEEIIFPYDSSRACGRAMRAFVNRTQGVPLASKVTLLRVEDDRKAALNALGRPKQYLEAYGYEVKLKVVPGDPPAAVLAYVKERMPTFVVLGASGKGAVKQLLFGSVIKTLLEDGTIPFVVSE